MTFVIQPSVNTEMKPSDIASAIDALLPDCVLSSALSLTELGAPSLNLQVGTGVCHIHGYYVTISAAETKALSASHTHDIYIHLVKNANGQVTGAAIRSSIDDTIVSADAMYIATVITDGTNITSITSGQDVLDVDYIHILKQSSTPSDPELDTRAKVYLRSGDSNNKVYAAKMKANGSIREVIAWG